MKSKLLRAALTHAEYLKGNAGYPEAYGWLSSAVEIYLLAQGETSTADPGHNPAPTSPPEKDDLTSPGIPGVPECKVRGMPYEWFQYPDSNEDIHHEQCYHCGAIRAVDTVEPVGDILPESGRSSP